MVSLYIIFYACLELRFPDVDTNPGPRRPVPMACRMLCSNVRGLSKNLSDVTVASAQYDLLLCSETLVSDRHHMSELLDLDSWIWLSCIVVLGWSAACPWDGCICLRWIWGILPT